MNQQDKSIKSCNATYAPCGEQQTQVAYNDTSESQLVLNLELSDQTKYCYIVNASNNNFSVLIEGSITGSECNDIFSIRRSNCHLFISIIINFIATAQPSRQNGLQSGEIAGIVITILCVILISAITVIIISCWSSKKKGTCIVYKAPIR